MSNCYRYFLSVDPDKVRQIYRLRSNSKVFLDRDPELDEIKLDLTCLDPCGRNIDVSGNELEVTNLAGPYILRFTNPFKLDKTIVEQTLLVDPVLGEEEGQICLDDIAVQSHLMKCCGPLSRWEDVYKVSQQSGYNVIHLTPIQQLGISNSSYSIHSHLSLSPTLQLSKGSYKDNLEEVSAALSGIRARLGLYFLTDVVWNHVSICNEDVVKHEDAFYNLANTPNLIPAYLVDREIGIFEYNLIRAETSLTSEEDVDKIMILLQHHFESSSVKEKIEGYLKDTSYSDLIRGVLGAVRGAVMYRFVHEHGLQYTFPEKNLIDRYFYVPNHNPPQEMILDLTDAKNAAKIVTCNGWTMGESIEDMSTTQAYLKREVVIWGDTIKLRYGADRSDSPWLWNYMTQYTCDMARIFHGFRIDNCHNTPIHVGEYLLQRARHVRPNLYVVAELFTGSEDIDKTYINKMGINSCIRELQNAGTPQKLGELAYYYGESKPCGSLVTSVAATGESVAMETLSPSRPHAMLSDQTHDNPCPFDKHPVANILALSTVMVSAKCSIGSNRGYDELVPHHINVVSEERLYQTVGYLPENSFVEAKNTLIKHHHRLEKEGYTETFVDQVCEEVIVVTRHNPKTGAKVLTAVAADWNLDTPDKFKCLPYYPSIRLPGKEVEVLLEIEASLNGEPISYERNQHIINGITNLEIKVRENVQQSNLVSHCLSDDELFVQLKLKKGQIAMFRVIPTDDALSSISFLQQHLLNSEGETNVPLENAMKELDLYSLNRLLYRCHEEEEVDGCGGVYEVPSYGKLVYAGIQGFLTVLDEIRQSQDMGHPICSNLCSGWWALEYTIHRLKYMKHTAALVGWMEMIHSKVRHIPNYMRVKAFDVILRLVYDAALRRLSVLLPGFGLASKFKKMLMLTSVQLVGKVIKTGIPLEPQKKYSDSYTDNVSMAAGLPHFSHGFMRCWGRDTFISLPGLLLSTGRLKDAKDLILGFARTLRHGLIPNLLSENGASPRYNCRDAVWWWCRAVYLYYTYDDTILSANVCRKYDYSDSNIPEDSPQTSTILDILQEILQKHINGIDFVEWNAGKQLDEHLKWEGFNIKAWVDPETGFVHGGSRYNCGTWMDKVGSSDYAGNRGIPSSPRDGAAIEIVSLSYQLVVWMHQLQKLGVNPYYGIEIDDGDYLLTYAEWARKIRDSFEEKFWYEAGGFYRDTVSSQIPENDCKLRPNQTIAMVVAPELLKADHVTKALDIISRELEGPLGMATLAPSDPEYRPFYDNANGSDDYRTANGFNYHQGPEWVWCMGYYLRAVHAAKPIPDSEVYFNVKLAPHRKMISLSPYRGLTELTNQNGEICVFSCPTQAWSSGCMLEFLDDLQRTTPRVFE